MKFQKNKILKYLGVVFLGFFVGFCIVEIIVRVEQLSPQTGLLYQRDGVIGIKHVPNARVIWRDKEISTEIRINGEGFRDRDHAIEKPPGVYRIVFLGDSYVEALQVPVDFSLPRVLEKKLNALSDGLRFEVLNFGVSGFGTAQEYLVLKQYALKYQPDLVVLAFLSGNDVRNNHPSLEGDPFRPYYVLSPAGQLEYKTFTVSRLLYLREISVRYLCKVFCPQTLIWFYDQVNRINWTRSGKTKLKQTHLPPQIGLDNYVYSDPFPPVWEEAWKVTEKLIEKSKVESEAAGAHFLLLLLTDSDGQITGQLTDYLRSLAAEKGPNFDDEKPMKLLTKFSKENQIDFLPLLPGFHEYVQATGHRMHYIQNGHWNPEGHRLAADLLLKHLMENQLKDQVKRN